MNQITGQKKALTLKAKILFISKEQFDIYALKKCYQTFKEFIFLINLLNSSNTKFNHCF